MAAERRWRAVPIRFPAAVLATVAAGGVLLSAAVGNNDSTTEMARMSLAGGTGSAALFTARQLVPGHAVSNCLPIVNGRTTDHRVVRLAATDLTGPLVAGLRIRVELGTGGTLGDCTGFTGATVFDGPLAGLAASATGISTGWVPAADQARTYRLTVEVADDNALQHSSASGTLTWLRGATPPSTALPSAPATTPATSVPSSEPDGRENQESVPRTQAPFFDAASSSGAPDRDAVRAGGPAGGMSAEPAPAVDGWHAAANKVADVADVAFKLCSATAGHPWFLLASLTVMWLLLFALDRSEKRDPKRAYLRFPPDGEDNA